MAVMTNKEVQRLMLQKAEGSCLDERDVKRLGFKAFTLDEAKKSLKLAKYAALFRIPYFDLDGRPNGYYRVRYMEDVRDSWAKVADAKQQRYAQPAGSSLDVYLPPSVSWRELAADPGTPILITEGELKAACATKWGLPTVGLGGVWSFRTAKEGKLLLDEIKELGLKDRIVYICYDSDAATNPKVVQAENALARELTAEGAIVSICRLPPDPEMDAKVGLDDWFYKHAGEGLVAAALFKEEVLDKAIPYEECKVLHGLNSEVVYVKNPGFVYVYEDGQQVATEQFKNSTFANRYYTEMRTVGKTEVPVKVPAAPKWITWEHRAEVKGLTYAPGKPQITDDAKLNTWMGWGVGEPRPGSVEPWHHLMQHLFGKDDAARIWFERWCAYPIQYPGTKMHTAVLLWGVTHGSGKTLAGHTLMRLYGRHAAELKDSDLEDESNSWAADISFVLGDDISTKLDRQKVRRMMTMITQKWVRVNPKYIKPYNLPDRINYMYNSNEPDTFYLDDGDRRFFIHEVMADKYKDYKSYVEWAGLQQDGSGDDLGVQALWHYLLTLDLGDFDPYAPAPETVGKSEMLSLGKSDLGSFVHDLKENGHVLLRKKQMAGDLFTAKELMALYDPEGNKKVTVNALARELKKQGFRHPATGTNLLLPDESQVMVYAILNGEKWAQANRKEALEHYVSSKPKGFWEVKRSKM